MKYLLDTNVLIEAKNGFYAFDLCPGFWQWLKLHSDMRSIQMVKEEITAGGDDLSNWVKNELPEGYFLPETEAVQQQYAVVADYVNKLPDFDVPKKNVFLGKADGWLIAAAIHYKASIVTHEAFDRGCRKKILLPVIADHFKISCVKIFDVLRDGKAQFSYCADR